MTLQLASHLPECHMAIPHFKGGQEIWYLFCVAMCQNHTPRSMTKARGEDGYWVAISPTGCRPRQVLRFTDVTKGFLSLHSSFKIALGVVIRSPSETSLFTSRERDRHTSSCFLIRERKPHPYTPQNMPLSISLVITKSTTLSRRRR